MRSYILTERERAYINKFIETEEVTPDDYVTWTQLRHGIRKHKTNLERDLLLLEKFMATPYKPTCFGSDDVLEMDGVVKRKCLMCAPQGLCLVRAQKRKQETQRSTSTVKRDEK